MFGDGWRRSKARRFDSYQMDGAWKVGIGLDDEVSHSHDTMRRRGRTGRRDQFRADTRIGGDEVRGHNRRQKLSCEIGEVLDGFTILFIIIFVSDVTCGRADEDTAPQGLGEMHAKAEAVCVGKGVHQAAY